MEKGSALVISGVGTLTTWLRVMTRSKVSQQVFTTAAGKQGSTSRSKARTCRVVVASLVPTGAEQPLSLWHTTAKPCPKQRPHDSSGADPQNQGEHSPDFREQESNGMAEKVSKHHSCLKDIHTHSSNPCTATSPLPSKSLFTHSDRVPHTQLQTPCSSAPHLQLFQSPAHRTWQWRVLQGDAQGLHRQT